MTPIAKLGCWTIAFGMCMATAVAHRGEDVTLFGSAVDVWQAQQSIKATAPWPTSVGKITPLHLQDTLEVDFLRSPVGLTLSPGGLAHVLDNLTGALHQVDLARRSQSFVETKLRYPRRLRERSGVLYAATGYGLQKLRYSGELLEAIRNPFNIGDFHPLKDGTFLINPLSRVDSGPLIAHIDRDGRVKRAWGRIAADNPLEGATILLGRAWLDVCGAWVAVARLYGPAVEWFSLTGAGRLEMTLPMPGGDRLVTLGRTPALANPEPGFYDLPTFAKDLTCVDGVAYVLLDLPYLAIATLDPRGGMHVLADKNGKATNREWSGLVVRKQADGVVEVYSLAQPREGTSWILVRATAKPVPDGE